MAFLPVPDTLWRILPDPETAKRPLGWVAHFYERRPDLRPPAESEAGQHETRRARSVGSRARQDHRVSVQLSGRCSSILASSRSMPRPGASVSVTTPFSGLSGVLRNHWWM